MFDLLHFLLAFLVLVNLTLVVMWNPFTISLVPRSAPSVIILVTFTVSIIVISSSVRFVFRHRQALTTLAKDFRADFALIVQGQQSGRQHLEAQVSDAAGAISALYSQCAFLENTRLLFRDANPCESCVVRRQESDRLRVANNDLHSQVVNSVPRLWHDRVLHSLQMECDRKVRTVRDELAAVVERHGYWPGEKTQLLARNAELRARIETLEQVSLAAASGPVASVPPVSAPGPADSVLVVSTPIVAPAESELENRRRDINNLP